MVNNVLTTDNSLKPFLSMAPIPPNFTLSIEMVSSFFPMVMELFDGLYLNEDNEPTLTLDVGVDVTVRSVGKEIDCSEIGANPNLELLEMGPFKPISLPDNKCFLFPKMENLMGQYTYYKEKIYTMINSVDYENLLPNELKNGNYSIIVASYLKIADEMRNVTFSEIDSRKTVIRALDAESASKLSNLASKDIFIGQDANLGEFPFTLTAEFIEKLKNEIDTNFNELRMSKIHDNIGYLNIVNKKDVETTVYNDYPPPEYVLNVIPVRPSGTTPLDNTKCYKFTTEQYGRYYVDIKNKTLYGGLYLANALKKVQMPIPVSMLEGIYIIASLKVDYLPEGEVTKINITNIFNDTAILFTSNSMLTGLLGGLIPEIAVINKPIELPFFLENVDMLLQKIKDLMGNSSSLPIPDGPIGLDNITAFLPLAYHYFDGLFLGLSGTPSFIVNAMDTAVVGSGNVIDCDTVEKKLEYDEKVHFNGTAVVFNNTISNISGIIQLDYGKDEKDSKIIYKVNASEYSDVLPNELKNGSFQFVFVFPASSYHYNSGGDHGMSFEKKYSTIIGEQLKIRALNQQSVDILNRLGDLEIGIGADERLKEFISEENITAIYETIANDINKWFSHTSAYYYYTVPGFQGKFFISGVLKGDYYGYSSMYGSVASQITECPEINDSGKGDGDDDRSDNSSHVQIASILGMIVLLLVLLF